MYVSPWITALENDPRKTGASAVDDQRISDGLICANDPVDDRGGGRRVEEDFGPARKRQIRRHHEAAALVALADEAEEQVGAGFVERDVSQFVQ